MCSFRNVSALLHACSHMFGYQLGLKAADRVRVSKDALGIVLGLIAFAAGLSLHYKRTFAGSRPVRGALTANFSVADKALRMADLMSC
jgi:hypothetical protein